MLSHNLSRIPLEMNPVLQLTKLVQLPHNEICQRRFHFCQLGKTHTESSHLQGPESPLVKLSYKRHACGGSQEAAVTLRAQKRSE